MVKDKREGVAAHASRLYQNKLPPSLAVLHKQNASDKGAKIKERSRPRTQKQKMQYVTKCCRRLHNEQGTVLFELEGKNHYHKPCYSKALSDQPSGRCREK